MESKVVPMFSAEELSSLDRKLFHSHHADKTGRIGYHLHGRANTLRQAIRGIRGDDKWQMNGRKW